GERSEISLKRTVPTNLWDSSKNRGRGKAPNITALNAYLDQVYGQLLDCQKQLLEESKVVTAKSIKARYLGEDDTHKTLRERLEYHYILKVYVLKPGTLKNYFTTERYLERFMQEKLETSDVYLKQLNYRVICDFE